MRREYYFAVLFLIVALGVGSHAQEPPKRVMNFIAVLDIQCGKRVDPDLSAPLTNIIIDEMVKIGTYTVIDRANRDKILSEQGFQQSCHAGECVVEMGRLLGVGKIVVGNIDLVGQTYLINLQLLNVETAAVENSVNEKCVCNEEGLIDAIRSAAAKLMGRSTSSYPIKKIRKVKSPPLRKQLKSPSPPPPVPPVPTPPAPQVPQPPAIGVQVGDMILIPAGEFMMGCNEETDNQCGDYEKPYHKVFLDSYYIDKFEVTTQQYAACVKAGKCSNAGTGGSCNSGVVGRDLHPINCVDWDQAKAFCEFAGKRLPTEAEWEKAARGTDGRKYPWGKQEASCSYAVMKEKNASGCGKNSTWPVGNKPSGASPYGAMDMGGNVWEWVYDWYGENYYQNSPAQNPTGPSSGTNRVLRGGSWGRDAADLRVSGRFRLPPAGGRGFRCAKNP